MSRQEQLIGVLIVSLTMATSRGAIAEPGALQETAEPRAGITERDPAIEAQLREIASNLRCPTCRALSVLDSPSGLASEMRDLIREQLAAGMTAEQIYAYFVDRYGEWILLRPRATGFNWTVWLLPLVLLAVGFILVLSTARRWVRRGKARDAALFETDS